MNDSQRLHEEGIVKGFIIRERQSRYLEFLNRPKCRGSFTGELAHFKHLDPAFVQLIPPAKQNVAGISELLREKGDPRIAGLSPNHQSLIASYSLLSQL